MSRRLLLLFAAAHVCGAASDAKFDALSEWLKSLKLQIPKITTTTAIGNVTFWGQCNGLSLETLDTNKTGTRLDLAIEGLGLNCLIKTQSSVGEIDVAMMIGEDAKGEDSKLDLSLDVTSDGDRLTPMPAKIQASKCSGSFKFPVPLKFSGSTSAQILDKTVGPILTGILTHESVLCGGIEGSINMLSGRLLGKADTYWRKELAHGEPRADDPVVPDDPNSDLVDIQSNPIFPALQAFLGELMNESSPQYINKMLPGELCADSMLPKTLSKYVADVNVSVTVKNLTVVGLNNWSRLAVDVHNANKQKNYQVELGLGNKEMLLKTAIRLELRPGIWPLAGDALREDFDLTFNLTGFDFDTAAALIFNASTWGDFKFLELFQASAFGSGVHVAKLMDLALTLPHMDVTLVPADRSRSQALETGLDRTITALAQLVLVDYGGALNAIIRHELGTTVRDKANSAVVNYLGQEPTWTHAPPVYKSESMHEFGLVASAGVAAVFVGMALSLRFFGKSKVKSATGPLEEGLAGAALAQQVHRAPGSTTLHTPDHAWDSLATHPRLGYVSKIGLPLVVFSTMCLFISSNAGVGVDINVALTANGQNVINPPPAMEETLLRNVIDMWKGGVYPLSIFIGFFSGVWPYMKLSMMLVCWFVPVHKLSVHRRQIMLEFLDAFGKWSLVDTYVLVMFLVAFDVPLTCTGAIPALGDICKAAGMDGEFRVYVLPTMGFHFFLIATLMSLAASLWMSWCHRYAQQTGEYGPAQDYDHDERQGNKRALSQLLVPEEGYKLALHKCVPTLVVMSLILCVCGIFMKTFRFKFLGVMGYVLGEPANVRQNSLWSLATALPEHSINPNSVGIHWIEVFFLVFSGVTVLFFLVNLLVLWVVPMTVRQHRKALVLAQTINAVSGLDVFVISIMASVFQIQPYAQFILREIGLAGINPLLQVYLPQIPFIASKIEGGYNVFDLNSQVMPGFVMLACACIISTVLGLMLLNKCSKALFDSDHRPLEQSFREAGASQFSGAV